MLFNLVALSNGKERLIRFDNVRNLFFDEQGKNILELYNRKKGDLLKKDLHIPKVNIELLFITLGLSCNFRCKYCHQNPIRKTNLVSQFTPRKVDSFIEILRKSKIHPKNISFWGGEPLVYWKTLQVLVPKLRDLYPDTKINFPTNGSLLSKEKIDFCKRYRIGFYISYDGKINNRGTGIFDNPCVLDAVRKSGRKISIMPTLNRASITQPELLKHLQSLQIPLDQISAYSIARCNPLNGGQAEDIRIPDEKIQEYQKFAYDVLHQSPDVEWTLYKGLQERLDQMLICYATGADLDEKSVSYCGHQKGKEITIDCEGHIFNCMNLPIKILGNLTEEEIVFKNIEDVYQKLSNKKRCLECPYVTTCRGGCPLIHDDHSLEFDVNCHNLKAIAIPFFRTMVERLLGMYLKKIIDPRDGRIIAEF